MKRRRRGGCFGKILFTLFVLVILGAGAYYYFNPAGLEGLISRYQSIMEGDVPFQENTIEPEALTGSFYYNQLSEEDKIVYKEILQGVQNGDTEIYLHSTDPEAVGYIYQKVLSDMPDLFWCNGTASSTSYATYTMLVPEYTYVGEERTTKTAEIEAAAEECLNEVPADGTTYDKIKYVFEWLVNQTDYQLDSPDNQNIYSVFVNKASVCAGYARATQYLLQKCGIECIYVTGTITNQESHAWNIVNIDGQYYHVDTTWGDPVFASQEDSIQEIDAGANISYDYLCCNDEEVMKTHTWDATLNLPACTSNDYNYYILNNCYYETYDEQAILKAMNDTIYAGGAQTTFKFANDAVYQQAKEPILSDLSSRAMQNLMSIYGLSSISCGQMADDSTDKIVIYWKYSS